MIDDEYIAINIDRANGDHQAADRMYVDNEKNATHARKESSSSHFVDSEKKKIVAETKEHKQLFSHDQERFAQHRSCDENVNSTFIILNDVEFSGRDTASVTAATTAAATAHIRTANKRCQLCFNFIKLVPVMLTFTLLLWSYYAFVFYFCFYYVQSISERLLYLSVYHLLLTLLTWSFCKTTFTEIPKVPQQFVLPLETLTRLNEANSEIERKHILETFAQTLPTVNRTSSGSVRYCAFCNIVKPDRAHHCRMCGYCVLKMDHHCPWVNTCVCFYNYKYFLLYIGYALFYCVFIMIVTLKYFLEQWEELSKLRSSANIHVVLLFLISLALIISLFSLFSYHCYLVLKNRTTLESFRTPIFVGGPNKNGFDLGRFENFKEVFGTQPKYWFLPICTFSNYSGCSFPQSSDYNQKYLLVQTSDSYNSD